MAHYDDFTEYCYGGGAYYVPGTVNIGWLGASLNFEQMEPNEDVLDLVWDYCKISVAQYRGIHQREFCATTRSDVAERHGEMRLLVLPKYAYFPKPALSTRRQICSITTSRARPRCHRP
jgi:hypothetical protein